MKTSIFGIVCTALSGLLSTATTPESAPAAKPDKPHTCPLCVPNKKLVALSPAEVKADPDGDGFSTEDEVYAGTDPNDAASHPWRGALLSLTRVRIDSVPVTYQGADDSGRFVFLAGKQQIAAAPGADVLGWQVGAQRTSSKGVPIISLKNGRLVRWLAHGLEHSLPVSTLTFTQRGTNKSVSHHGDKGTVDWDGLRFRLDGVVSDKIKVVNPETGQEAWISASSGKIKSDLFKWIDRVRPK